MRTAEVIESRHLPGLPLLKQIFLRVCLSPASLHGCLEQPTASVMVMNIPVLTDELNPWSNTFPEMPTLIGNKCRPTDALGIQKYVDSFRVTDVPAD